MSEPVYSVKEIIELQFSNLSKELGEIKSALRDQSKTSEGQFSRLDKEIDNLRKDINKLQQSDARYKTIWGIGATVGASFIAFVFNRIF